MTVASGWTIAKDALSFAGGLLVSIPWFLDFAAKVDLTDFKSIPTKLRSYGKVVAEREAWVAAPKLRDFVLTSIGLILICISFGVALLQSLGVLPS